MSVSVEELKRLSNAKRKLEESLVKITAVQFQKGLIKTRKIRDDITLAFVKIQSKASYSKKQWHISARIPYLGSLIEVYPTIDTRPFEKMINDYELTIVKSHIKHLTIEYITFLHSTIPKRLGGFPSLEELLLNIL